MSDFHSKKLDAAEKHFAKKLKKIERDNTRYDEALADLRKTNKTQATYIEELEATIGQQEIYIKKLMEYSSLDKKDIRAACEKDKHMASVMGMISGASNMFGVPRY